jgi:hypothetical protein
MRRVAARDLPLTRDRVSHERLKNAAVCHNPLGFWCAAAKISCIEMQGLLCLCSPRIEPAAQPAAFDRHPHQASGKAKGHARKFREWSE